MLWSLRVFWGGGVWAEARIFQRRSPAAFAPNVKAQASLGITGREYEALKLLAAGCCNKEIAQGLAVSPDTVKTYVARPFEKL